MAVSVSVVDSADGTGGVATVAGSDVGSTNTLYRARFTGGEEELTWATVGSRTGDGVIAAGTPVRHFWLWYVKSVSGATTSVSPVVHKALTDATYKSVRTRCVEAIQATLQLLDLEGIGTDTTKILIRQADSDPVSSRPCLIVLNDDTISPVENGGTNARDGVEPGVLVLFLDHSASGTVAEAQVEKWEIWQERSERAFRGQRLAGVSEVMFCRIESASVKADDVRRSFVVRCVTRQARGLEA